MTPSAISFAISLPFGPSADSRSGTSIGRGDENSSVWIICADAPSTSTVSPASSARSCSK